MSRPFGRKPYGRDAATRSGCPASAGQRYPPLRCADCRACKRGPDPSSVPGILSPFQITVKGAPAARRLLAQPHTLDCDLPRQDHRHLSVGRGSPSPPSPHLRKVSTAANSVSASRLRTAARYSNWHTWGILNGFCKQLVNDPARCNRYYGRPPGATPTRMDSSAGAQLADIRFSEIRSNSGRYGGLVSGLDTVAHSWASWAYDFRALLKGTGSDFR